MQGASGIGDATIREPSERHSEKAGDDSVAEAVARIGGGERFALEPTGATTTDVGEFQIFFRERELIFEQIEYGFGKLRAGGPGLVDAGTGEDIGAAGTFADAGIAIAREKGFAVTARFLKRFGSPGFESAASKMTP